MTTTTLEGLNAIDYAEAHGLTLNKYADPTEDAREGLSVSEAREVAREDASLIYVSVPLGATCDLATDSTALLDELGRRFHGDCASDAELLRLDPRVWPVDAVSQGRSAFEWIERARDAYSVGAYERAAEFVLNAQSAIEGVP
jgi:hypothetical protein